MRYSFHGHSSVLPAAPVVASVSERHLGDMFHLVETLSTWDTSNRSQKINM
jgi:hypothetical protein